MSKREVICSIRFQILMVFFLPLVMAIIHIAVAFPVITKLLSVFYLKNTKLFFGCTAGTVGIFAVFYVIVFVITAKESLNRRKRQKGDESHLFVVYRGISC